LPGIVNWYTDIKLLCQSSESMRKTPQKEEKILVKIRPVFSIKNIPFDGACKCLLQSLNPIVLSSVH
jgi:hypothetical protein